MKYISLLILWIVTLIWTFGNAFCIEKSSIQLEQNPVLGNTKENIERAQAIEKEIVLFQQKLEKIKQQYHLEKDSSLQKFRSDLEEIIYILRKIQTTKVNKYTAEYVIEVVITDIKNINIQVKQYIRSIQMQLEIQRKKYDNLSLKLYQSLHTITSGLLQYYKTKPSLSSRDKDILLSIQTLKEKEKQLLSFPNMPFYSLSELKLSLGRIIQSSLKEMQYLRSLIENS